MAVVKKLPATETGAGVTYITKSGKEYRISQNPTTAKHTLWAVLPEGYEKITTAASPLPLYEKIESLEKQR